MKYIILILKGMVIGLANIIPGVSGGTLMITLGIYEDIINAISHFFKNFKKNIQLLLPLGIGMGLSILILSKIISICLEKYQFATTFFFIGLILGGIPLLWKKAKVKRNNFINWFIFLLTFLLVTLFAFLNGGENIVNLDNLKFFDYIILFLVGIISAATMVIPGISGSFVLMLLGYYKPIIDTIKTLTDFSVLGHNLLILVPFGFGIIFGIIGVAKLIEFLLKKYTIQTYYGVLGFVLASMVAIIKPLLSVSPSIFELIIGIILVIGGGIGAFFLGEK